MESDHSKLETLKPANEESPVPSDYPERDVRSGDGFDESTPNLSAKGPEDRSRPEPSPCPIGIEQSAVSKYPDMDTSAVSESAPFSPTDQERRDSEDPALRRGKRGRRRKGFYKQLHEGSL